MTNTKRTNKVISLLLCFIMIMSVLPMGVFAVQAEFVHSDDCPYEPYVPCSHTHDDQCGGAEDCSHEHDEECAYYIGEDCSCAIRIPVYAYYRETEEQEFWETYGSSDFQPLFIRDEPLEISTDDYPQFITVEGQDYTIQGLFSLPTGGDEENVTLVDSITIPIPPSDTESDEYYMWMANWSDGIYPVYILSDSIHAHYANDGSWATNPLNHWQICEGCDESFNSGRHEFGLISVCTVCGLNCEHGNTFLSHDEVKHWYYCLLCSKIVNRADHADENSDDLCDQCNCDLTQWHYFGFSNSYDDFFAAGETRNYVINDYEESFIEWVGERYSYPGWRNDIQMILDLQYSSWGGSCFGYAAVESLFNLGLLDFEDYDPSMYAITQFPAPSKTHDKDIRSLLNYYYLTQFLTACRNESYNLAQTSGRNEMLEFAEYIVNGQNKAMFCYFFTEYGYTYGHAFVVDGGIKNADGSYILNAYDNRYHGYKWSADDSDVILQVKVAPNGTAKVYCPSGPAKKGTMSGTLYAFEEVITSFEYYKADATSFATFESLLPWDEDMLDVSTTWVYAPKVVLVPVNAQGTETMKVSTDEFEVCVNDFAEGTPETEAIEKSYMIYGGLSSALSDEFANENTPGGVMFELGEVADSYSITAPAGTVSLSTDSGLTTLITDGAESAEFDTESGVVSVDNNNGDFSITVTTTDGTIARVSGTANGDLTVTPKDSTVELSAPNGTYNVEYTKADDTVTDGTIRIGSTSTGGGGGVSRYTIKFDTNGGTEIANKTVTRNSLLAEPEAPTKDGYTFNGWYTDEELTEKYDFNKAVTKGFTLYAKWEKHDDEESVTPEWENPFTDVTADDWFYNDVRYVNENSLMNGTSETTFAPNDNLTRAMLVTVLYRLEGEPEMKNAQWFEDVEKGQWYSDAVSWATFNGITMGYGDGNFGPDDNITREQIAAIMHRYAQYKGYDVSVGENTNILSYDDFDSISEYAIASMQYACGSGLMKGKSESTLNPLDNATRAEIAAILHRFIEANK